LGVFLLEFDYRVFCGQIVIAENCRCVALRFQNRLQVNTCRRFSSILNDSNAGIYRYFIPAITYFLQTHESETQLLPAQFLVGVNPAQHFLSPEASILSPLPAQSLDDLSMKLPGLTPRGIFIEPPFASLQALNKIKIISRFSFLQCQMRRSSYICSRI